MQHRIAVIRHARAESQAPSDAERALAPRGTDDARTAGSWLASQGFTPERALVSAALRTRQTWSALAEAAGWDLEAETDQSLYTASAESVLDLLRRTGDDVSDVVVVGHNPAMAVVAQLLDDGTGDAAAGAEMLHGFAPGAVALFEHDGAWADLAFPSARLVAFHAGPR